MAECRPLRDTYTSCRQEACIPSRHTRLRLQDMTTDTTYSFLMLREVGNIADIFMPVALPISHPWSIETTNRKEYCDNPDLHTATTTALRARFGDRQPRHRHDAIRAGVPIGQAHPPQDTGVRRAHDFRGHVPVRRVRWQHRKCRPIGYA